MKRVLKGLLLGLSLVAANYICSAIFKDLPINILMFFSGVVFFTVTTVFLVSKNIPELLLCGFSGLFIMFFAQIFIIINFNDMFFDCSLNAYMGGFWGSMIAIIVSVILTIDGFSFKKYFNREEKNMNENITIINTDATPKKLKLKLLLYAVLSAIGFSYLVMPESAGISVIIFTLMQFVFLWFIAPSKKRLILFVPLFIMSINCFISANDIWRIPNLIISIILYSCMFMNISFKHDSAIYFSEALERILRPLSYIFLPMRWILELNSEKAPLIKRILLAIIIATPSTLILVAVLSNADMVFSLKTADLFEKIFDLISFNSIFIIICGIIAGLYLFGTLYCSLTCETYAKAANTTKKGDLIILNTLLCAILLVYTMFVIIQFKYLFAGATLPDGLIYSEYARKGFFELVFLTCVNIAIILGVTKLTKIYTGGKLTFTKLLCHYLCLVTVVLLISSFYRMILYVDAHGLTQMRLFVMVFLIFEAIGLWVTFIYITKPKFNITLIYLIISLSYYCLLNLIPTDRIIAENQVNRHMLNKSDDSYYVLSLSADAAPAIKRLYDNTNDDFLKGYIEWEIQYGYNHNKDIPNRWQRFNLSTTKADKIYESIK